MTPDPLARFLDAQGGGVIERALAELRAGRKTTHWMWFVLPQIAGLGQSPTARHYAIRDRAEARAYLAHPVLRARLFAAVDALLGWAGRRGAEAMLGAVDAAKLRSSMTLFEGAGVEGAGGDARFGRVLDAFFAGARDPATLSLLDDHEQPSE